MAQFKSIKGALKQGYKISGLDYDFDNKEWFVYMKKDGIKGSLMFIKKSLPKHLKLDDFRKDIKKWSDGEITWIKLEMSIME